MKIKIVGIQDQNYKLDNGYAFDGFKVYCIDVETASENLIGNVTTTLRIPRNSPFAANLAVDQVYNVYFTQKGAVDFLQPCGK